MRSKRAGVLAGILIFAIALAAGLLLARQLNQLLGISFTEVSLPDESALRIPVFGQPLPAIEPIDAIVLPDNVERRDLYLAGAAELAHAIHVRTGATPATVYDSGSPLPGRMVVVREADAVAGSREAVELRSDGRFITITATPLGGVYGMAYLAERLLSDLGEQELASLDQVVEPMLRHRLVDLGGVGIEPDSILWSQDDYSHHSRAFETVMLADGPYLDQAALEHAAEQFRAYVHRMAAYGYNGIVFKGFLEYINFDRVGNGTEVYAADSVFRQRHLALRSSFGELFQYAHGLGFRVILSTDMLALTPPLERYLQQRFGRLDPADPAIWEVYRLGMAELFEALPQVDGVMIRIGEAGTVYNLPGWDYYSELHVRTVPSVRAMLRALSATAADYGRTLVFRTWSVGVGEVGAMHTRPEDYLRVLDGLELPNLLVSTKYVAGDFYSYLPLNPTLATGREPRIVEFQARREYEGFNAFPNYLGPLHQLALRELRSGNPRVEGVWVWTQEGGPPRAGPWSLYPFHGFWELIDANVYVTARLAWNPEADLGTLTQAWVRRVFGDEPEAVENLTRLLLLSRDPVLRGLYLEPFARRQVSALGLEPPPMLWIFEWDLVSGASSVLSTIYFANRGQLQAVIDDGFQAIEDVGRMQALVTSLPQATQERDPYPMLLGSLAYQESLLTTLAWYRTAFLSYYRWLDSGDATVHRDWKHARARFDAARQAHVETYRSDLDFPAYDFVDADAGMAHARRGPTMSWLARLLIVVTLGSFLIGTRFAERRTRPFPAKRGFGALWRGVFRPSDTSFVGPATAADHLVVTAGPLIVSLAALLVFSSFLSPTLLLFGGAVLAALLAAMLLTTRTEPRLHALAGMTAPLLLLFGVLLAPVAVRGPGFFWYRFWTDQGFRTVLISVLVVLAAWLLAAVFVRQRALGWPARTAVGSILLALGAPLLILATLLQGFGLERALTALNNEMAILPRGLSLTLGISTHLNIPSQLPLQLISLGIVLLSIGAFLLLATRWRDRRPS
jgi:hypothetical protein